MLPLTKNGGGIMPNNKIVDETDGDPNTAYEDTTAHERLGFGVDDSEKIGKEDRNVNQSDEQTNG
jgi:hypothetical protein